MKFITKGICCLLIVLFMCFPVLAEENGESTAFDILVAHFKDNFHLNNGRYLAGMHSVIGEDSYLWGLDSDGEHIAMVYFPDGENIAFYGKLDRYGMLDALVIVETDNEYVSGSIIIDARTYQYDEILSDFSYESEQRAWRYENFKLRASAYIRDTLMYVNCMIDQLDLGLSLADLGFATFEEVSFFENEITQEDLAGIWELVTDDDSKLSCYMAKNSSYEWSWNGTTSPVTIHNVEEYLPQLYDSESLTISEYDYVAGKRYVYTVLNENIVEEEDVLRRCIFRDEDGTLYMRMESSHIGMTHSFDGLLFVKKENAPDGVRVTNYIPTQGERRALNAALDYLEVAAFSQQGLIEQLKYEGYSQSDSEYAVNNCGADWNEQALRCAKSYLDVAAFSYSGLVDQLRYEKFSKSQAEYGADHCGASWNQQAKKAAAAYLEIMDFSKSELIEQLEYEGFTYEQAVYGVEKNGY